MPCKMLVAQTLGSSDEKLALSQELVRKPLVKGNVSVQNHLPGTPFWYIYSQHSCSFCFQVCAVDRTLKLSYLLNQMKSFLLKCYLL